MTTAQTSTQNVIVGVRMPREIADRLSALAEKSGHSMSHFVKQSVIMCLPMHEAVLEAEENHRAVLAGKMKELSLEASLADYLSEHPEARPYFIAKGLMT